MASSAQSTLLDPLSFLKLTPDGDDVELSTGGAETRNINCSEENILAAPSDTDENFATEEKGATVRVASCIWGEGTSGREKVQNVLRLGARYGTPRFVDGDSSFIFKDLTDQPNRSRWMLLDLGAVVSLTRIGTAAYTDRWINTIRIETGTSVSSTEVSPAGHPILEGERAVWGDTRVSSALNNTLSFDRDYTDARFVLFIVSSAHFYGAGARMGPIFAYGKVRFWSPETHHTFPRSFKAFARAVQMLCRRDAERGGLVGQLQVGVWEHIFSYLARSDLPRDPSGLRRA
mmetsp:Transcript_63777/g.152095  ORF Transcript_63777/g.152095 Transcript_63777/m.152095 type:complete len:289 (+) Transcript_63777:134-1000(+)